ncbi:unnamed protein product [Arabidopsis halleri]
MYSFLRVFVDCRHDPFFSLPAGIMYARSSLLCPLRVCGNDMSCKVCRLIGKRRKCRQTTCLVWY